MEVDSRLLLLILCGFPWETSDDDLMSLVRCVKPAQSLLFLIFLWLPSRQLSILHILAILLWRNSKNIKESLIYSSEKPMQKDKLIITG